MRPIWSGGITFGLIYIPINLYSATKSVQLDLDMLSKKNLSKIRYARIDTKTGKEVPWKDVVKGFEFKKGDYVVLEDEDFEKVDLEKSENIEITSFVKESEIDPIYFEKPYYVEPGKGAKKTYALLVKALKKSKKVGVAEFILRNRENLCIIKPEGNMLILNQLRYEDEVRESDSLEIPKKADISDKELKMAETLIESMSDEFNISDFEDDYIKGLQKIIKAKSKGKTVKVKKLEKKDFNTEDLMEQLKKSLEEMNVKT